MTYRKARSAEGDVGVSADSTCGVSPSFRRWHTGSCSVQITGLVRGEGTPRVSDQPVRVLIVSADMGEGHNSAGRALEQAARARWPEGEVRWLDTLDVMGRGVGPVFRGIYVTNVQRTPWLYEFFYTSIRKWRWFATSSKSFVGNWAGRRLGSQIDAFQPDVVMSTYPLGSAGLAWLRRHGRLAMPAGAWICDFSPHPFWVYPDLDLNLVMHEGAVKPAQTG